MCGIDDIQDLGQLSPLAQDWLFQVTGLGLSFLLGFRVCSLRAWGLGIRVEGFGFGVS